MATNNNTSMTRAAFLKSLNAGTRTDATVNRASAYVTGNLESARFDRALWVHVRIATDAVAGETVAVEAGVSAGRISQIRAGLSAMVDAGIPLPTTVADADRMAVTYVHLSRIYKSGKPGRAAVRDAVKVAAVLDDVAAKFATFDALVVPSDDKEKRAARPNDGTTDAGSGDAPAGKADETSVPVTFTGALESLAAVAATADVPDLAHAMALVDAISDALAARLTGVTVADAETLAA